MIFISFTGNNGRTPLMAAMHEDDSPDLSEVARILGEVLEVDPLSLHLILQLSQLWHITPVHISFNT